MRKTLTTLIGATLILAVPLIAEARDRGQGLNERQHYPQARGPHGPGVNQRQHHQAERIGQGVRSGELTRDEVRELGAEQKSIRREEREYKSDGVLTRDERKDLHQDLNQASRSIYSEKHDDEKRAASR